MILDTCPEVLDGVMSDTDDEFSVDEDVEDQEEDVDTERKDWNVGDEEDDLKLSNEEMDSVADLLDGLPEVDIDITELFPLEEGEDLKGEDGNCMIAASQASREWAKMMGFEV